MTPEQLASHIKATAVGFPYIVRVEMVLRTPHTLKMRLHIMPDCFVQVYHNTQKNLVSYALVMGGMRIYGRNRDGRTWHRHPVEDPDSHDFSEEGQRPIDLDGFLMEVGGILTDLGVL